MRLVVGVSKLTLLLVVAIFVNKNHSRMLVMTEPWHIGTHLRVLSESYLMNTNMTVFRWFSKIFASLCFGRK